MQRGKKKTEKAVKVSPDALASLAQRQSTKTPGQNQVQGRKQSSGKPARGKYNTRQMQELLSSLRDTKQRIADPKEIEARMKEQFDLAMQKLDASKGRLGRADMSLVAAQIVDTGPVDGVSEVVDDIVSTANGYVSGFGARASTMQLAHDMAFGIESDEADLAKSILGDAIPQLESELAQRGATSYTPTIPQATVSVTVDAQTVCAATQTQVKGALEMVNTAAQAGIAKVKSLNSIVGDGTGARDLLQSCIDNLSNKAVAMLMAVVMGVVNSVHPMSHPLFIEILKMTWDQNKQWVPEFIRAEVEEQLGCACPNDIPPWMQPVKEICEYFDFVQEVMGGAIAEVWKGGEEMFNQIVESCAGGYNEADMKAMVAQAKEAVENPPAFPPAPPTPPLSVPLMSIAKQQWDVQQKLLQMKEMCRERGKLMLERLRSLEGPDMSIVPPEQMLLVMEVCIEVYVIYQNLSMVIDKLVEMFLNMLVEKFAGIAKGIIDTLFSIWNKVVEIVPPLQDLLETAWAIPNTADCCHCCAMNIALPECWSMIQPFIDLPFNCIDAIADACDSACQEAYKTPPP